jgi:hypothetical protein
MKLGPTGFPQTSVRNYHYSLRNDPEERSFHLLRGGRLKSLKMEYVSKNRWVHLSEKSIRRAESKDQ